MVEWRTLRTWACLAVLPGAVAGGCASSSNPFSNNTDFDRTFIAAAQTWDLNKDSVVTCDEWTQYITTEFRQADSNGDGALDAEEWKKLVRNDRLFEIANLAYYDANGDGRVTLEEMTGKQNLAFKLLDRNSDCQIDRSESVQVHGVDKIKPKDGGAPDTTTQGSGRPGGY
ncbi:EF-hand domain-containing protein [Hyphomicrobium sp. CS1GBMeth3]|uniref:EF-hand domain-containing protein n=1 Tax=Hyphomicrobium sp. CS1GBMeth3 TaxID=1892845 RepID=UPI0009303A9F|nr:EF-hand domain-containing protein [Hyphomicrobium sp. CS1GBMeth3]